MKKSPFMLLKNLLKLLVPFGVLFSLIGGVYGGYGVLESRLTPRPIHDALSKDVTLLAEDVKANKLIYDLAIADSDLKEMKLDLQILEQAYKATRSKETREQMEILKDDIKDKKEEIKAIKEKMGR